MVRLTLARARRLWGAAFLLVAAACNSSDMTSPSTGAPQVTAAAGGPSGDLLSLTGRITFVRNGHIYVMNADGTDTTRLTNSTATDETPAWSPGGTRIAFVRSRTVNGVLTSRAILVMNANGSGVAKLTQDTAYALDPAWSPDGTKIAFAERPAGTGPRGFEIFVMKPDGSGVTRLTNNLPFQGCGGPSRGFESSPSWSPDGTRIAFLHRTTCFSKDIDVMNANGTHVSRLTNSGFARKLAWGRTGKIAFDPSVFPGEGLSDGEIEVVTVNGATVTRLTNNAANDQFPAWSPDGTKLAFGSDRDGDFDIYAMNANGTGTTKLSHNSVVDNEPAWGP
jgi:Tol biopolymer transport system component